MPTVFSHIIQKRLAQENENIATDALAFILDSYQSARTGMMKLLRGLAPTMPELRFRTQATEGEIRPDMAGLEGSELRVYVENKFWAGLTDNQPVAYLKELARHTQPAVLLMVGPSKRVQTLWHEVRGRLQKELIHWTDQEAPTGIQCAKTGIGPILALTSWTMVLNAMELETVEELDAKNDILQLRALCEEADIAAFVPFSKDVVTDQRIPALLHQLARVVDESLDKAEIKGVCSRKTKRGNYTFSSSLECWVKGRMFLNGDIRTAGFAIGIHFDLWKQHGGSPLWLTFSAGEECRGREVRPLLEPWAFEVGAFTTDYKEQFAMSIDIPAGEGKDQVVEAIVDRLKMIAGVLSALGPNPWYYSAVDEKQDRNNDAPSSAQDFRD